MMHFLKKKRINKSLTNTAFGRNIVYMPVCDSTNEVAKRNLDLSHGTVFIADSQTNGKGRLGRSWASEKKSGIYMSILLKPELDPESVPQITLVAAVAVCRALGCNTKIKWPNDIVIGTRKVCGILTERVDNSVICGIGINVNTKSFPEEISDTATSLYIETKEKHDVDYICAIVMNEFEILYDRFIDEGFIAIVDEYKSCCVTLNRDVVVIRGGDEISAYAYDISPTGELMLETDDGDIEVQSGEVSVRGIYGYV